MLCSSQQLVKGVAFLRLPQAGVDTRTARWAQIDGLQKEGHIGTGGRLGQQRWQRQTARTRVRETVMAAARIWRRGEK